jgi:hypothetical protein
VRHTSHTSSLQMRPTTELWWRFSFLYAAAICCIIPVLKRHHWQKTSQLLTCLSVQIRVVTTDERWGEWRPSTFSPSLVRSSSFLFFGVSRLIDHGDLSCRQKWSSCKIQVGCWSTSLESRYWSDIVEKWPRQATREHTNFFVLSSFCRNAHWVRMNHRRRLERVSYHLFCELFVTSLDLQTPLEILPARYVDASNYRSPPMPQFGPAQPALLTV